MLTRWPDASGDGGQGTSRPDSGRTGRRGGPGKSGWRSKLLIALIIIVPAIELWTIIEVGRAIGGWATIGLIVLMGVGGAWLAREEGRRVWRDAREQMQSGVMPGMKMLDGLCVLLGGLLLLIPGFVTDIVGLTLLLPLTRPLYRQWLYRWLERKIRGGSIGVYRGPRSGPFG